MKTIISFLFILALSVTSIAQQQKVPIRVEVSVEASSPKLKTLFYNLLVEEIGAAKDVSIVNKLGVYKVSASVIEIRTSTNFFVGYAVSYTFTRTVLCQEFPSNGGEYEPKDELKFHAVMLSAPTELNQRAVLIKNKLDNYLNPIRAQMKTVKIIEH